MCLIVSWNKDTAYYKNMSELFIVYLKELFFVDSIKGTETPEPSLPLAPRTWSRFFSALQSQLDFLETHHSNHGHFNHLPRSGQVWLTSAVQEPCKSWLFYSWPIKNQHTNHTKVRVGVRSSSMSLNWITFNRFLEYLSLVCSGVKVI